MLKNILIILGAFIFLTVGALAQTFEDGADAFVKGDYKAAIKIWLPLAEQGDAKAQFNLGVIYVNGEGVPQNYALAGKYFRLAAEQGYAGAQSNLGVMYANGEGVPKDLVLAYMWVNLASANNESDRETRNKIAARMSPQQIEKAQELSKQCLASNYKDCP